MSRSAADETDEVAAHAGVESVPVASLVIAGSPRTSGEDPEHVRVLAAIESELPPILVHRSTMRVIDGAHRLRAARLRGDEHIEVRYFDGSAADAFILAVKANIGHGLPLSMHDRSAAAERILRSHPQWSDRMIAAAAGIAAKTVAEIRKRQFTGVPGDEVRIGQDGRARPVDGTQRRTIAAELLTENPDLSLRQVAKVAGISPETVRNVRNRLLYGRNPAETRGRRQESAAPDENRDEIIRRLSVDPALRHTESGRTLLRILHAQAISGEDWEKILADVPAHCVDLVSRAARGYARMWDEVADRIGENSPGMT